MEKTWWKIRVKLEWPLFNRLLGFLKINCWRPVSRDWLEWRQLGASERQVVRSVLALIDRHLGKYLKSYEITIYKIP